MSELAGREVSICLIQRSGGELCVGTQKLVDTLATKSLILGLDE